MIEIETNRSETHFILNLPCSYGRHLALERKKPTRQGIPATENYGIPAHKKVGQLKNARRADSDNDSEFRCPGAALPRD